MRAKINSNDFNRVIAATKAFVSTGNSYQKCREYIRLEFDVANSRMTAMAVDGYRMSVEHAICECDEDFTTYIRGSIKLPNKMDAFIEVTETDTLIRCGNIIVGCPKLECSDNFDWIKILPEAPSFRIAFNGNYLLSALQAAKESCGKSLRESVILEFRGPHEPVILRTNKDDIKMVLPVRIKDNQ